MTKTNEKITVKMDYFGKYGETKTLQVWSNGINDRKLVKIRGEFYFVSENGNLYQ